MPQSDLKVITCNYTTSTKVASNRARCYVLRTNPGGGNDRILLLVHSRGGRWIEKWEAINHLGYFRLKTIPPVNLRYSQLEHAPGKESLELLQNIKIKETHPMPQNDNPNNLGLGQDRPMISFTFDINLTASVELTDEGFRHLIERQDLNYLEGFHPEYKQHRFTAELWRIMEIFGGCFKYTDTPHPFVDNKITIHSV